MVQCVSHALFVGNSGIINIIGLTLMIYYCNFIDMIWMTPYNKKVPLNITGDKYNNWEAGGARKK